MGLRNLPDVSLIVPVMSNFKGFTELMESVNHPVYPIIVDNHTENRGVSWAWNHGLDVAKRQAGTELALICNDDVVFQPECIITMVEAMANDSRLDLVTAVNVRDHEDPGTGRTDEPDYSCFMVRARSVFDTPSLVDKFGAFDENFTPAYFEDNDMAYRIKVGGGKQVKLLSARMYHAGSVTQNMGGGQVVTSPMFEKNRAYYIAKWGGMPLWEKYTAPFNGITGKTYKDW